MKIAPALEVVTDTSVVEVKSGFNPREYFKDHKGLWVSSYFGEKILPESKTVGEDTVRNLSSFKLLRYAADREIENELPKEHTFTETEVCGIIASMLDAQPEGKEGDLLSNGNWNLFYTPGFVVSVRWRAEGGGWFVHCWGRGDDGWRGGFRVFSPAN